VLPPGDPDPENTIPTAAGTAPPTPVGNNIDPNTAGQARRNCNGIREGGFAMKTDANGDIVTVDVLNDPSKTAAEKYAALKGNLPGGYTEQPGPPGTHTVEWTGDDGQIYAARIYPDGSYSDLSPYNGNNSSDIHYSNDGKHLMEVNDGNRDTKFAGSKGADGSWQPDGSWRTTVKSTGNWESGDGHGNMTSYDHASNSYSGFSGKTFWSLSGGTMTVQEHGGHTVTFANVDSLNQGPGQPPATVTSDHGDVVITYTEGLNRGTVRFQADGTKVETDSGGQVTTTYKDHTVVVGDPKSGNYTTTWPDHSSEAHAGGTTTWTASDGTKTTRDSAGNVTITKGGQTWSMDSHGNITSAVYVNQGALEIGAGGHWMPALPGASAPPDVTAALQAAQQGHPAGPGHWAPAEDSRVTIVESAVGEKSLAKDIATMAREDGAVAAVKMSGFADIKTTKDVLANHPELLGKVALNPELAHLAGTAPVANPDGSSTATRPDGSSTVTYPDGSQRSFDAQGKLTGGRVIGSPAPSTNPAAEAPVSMAVAAESLRVNEVVATTAFNAQPGAPTHLDKVIGPNQISIETKPDSVAAPANAHAAAPDPVNVAVCDQHTLSSKEIDLHLTNANVGRPLDKVALNPQPLPPKALDLHVTKADLAGALDKVALNPQPLPPKAASAGVTTHINMVEPTPAKDPDVVPVAKFDLHSLGDRVALNPQPLPPKALDLHLTKAEAVGSADKVALNPQPLPPKAPDLHVTKTPEHVADSHYPAALVHPDNGQHDTHLNLNPHEAGVIAHDFNHHDFNHHDDGHHSG
jgi:hypothetical protein